MNTNSSFSLNPFDFYLLRVPRFPFSVIEKLNAKLTEPDIDQFLYDVFKEPQMQDAMLLVSGVLYNELIKWLNGPEFAPPKKLRLTLYKFLIRTAGRPTPYGLFAGVSLGTIGESSTSKIILSGDFDPWTRPDMQLSMFLGKQLCQTAETRTGLVFALNSSLLEKHSHYYYYEYREKAGKRTYHWVRIEKNPLLEQLIDSLEAPRNYEYLVNSLRCMGMTVSRASDFIDSLINNQLLESTLTASVTGEEYFNKLCRFSLESSFDGGYGGVFKQIQQMDNIRCSTVNFDISVQQEIRKLAIGTSIGNYFQTDLRVGTDDNQLSASVVQTIIDEIGELMPLNRFEVAPDLDHFKHRFQMRYSDREIPLLEALDPELGVGYGINSSQYVAEQSLLKSMKLHHKKAISSKFAFEKEAFDYKLSSYFGDILKEVRLTTQDIHHLTERIPVQMKQLPPSFYLMGQLLAQTSEALGQLDFMFLLKVCGGSSALPLMARFAYMDNQLTGKLASCAQWDDDYYSGAIVAEIVHLPDSRVGNIIKRPVLRRYEIPILAVASVEPDFQIPLKDILISVRAGQIWLRSKKFNKWIIPRLASAHNYQLGIAPYRFLCDLQSQSGQVNINWNWGGMNNRAYLPRVSYKHLILSRARWRIPAVFMQTIQELVPSEKINLLIDKFRLPSQVIMADGDNELYLDLTNHLAVHILLERLQKGDVFLYEVLSTNMGSPIQDQKGFKYINEIILPVKNNKCEFFLPSLPVLYKGIRRIFPPGSEWVYLKLYSGERHSDVLLAKTIAPFVDRLTNQGLIDKWFFIRYHDPDPHLRIRFLQTGSTGYGIITKQIYETFKKNLDDGEIFNIQFDTYERELERYFGDCIEECESIFSVDSRFVLALLTDKKANMELHARWLAGVRGIDQLLEVFKIKLLDRVQVVDKWRLLFLEEFKAEKQTIYQMDLKYREYRNLIEAHLRESNQSAYFEQDIYQYRAKALEDPVTKLINKLNRYYPDGHEKMLERLLSSLCHMLINRIFFSNQRQNELVIYHFLRNYYVSCERRICRSKAGLDLVDDQ